MNKIKYFLCFAAILECLTLKANADTAMTFKGSLIIPSCTVNNNTEVSVPFNDIEIQTLTAANTAYDIKQIAIPLNCPYVAGTPNITISSSMVHDAAKGILQTSKYSQGLVIYLLQKDATTAIPIGTATDISKSLTISGNAGTLTLNAGVGRIDDLSKLTAGDFTSSATLQVQYQ